VGNLLRNTISVLVFVEYVIAVTSKIFETFKRLSFGEKIFFVFIKSSYLL